MQAVWPALPPLHLETFVNFATSPLCGSPPPGGRLRLGPLDMVFPVEARDTHSRPAVTPSFLLRREMPPRSRWLPAPTPVPLGHTVGPAAADAFPEWGQKARGGGATPHLCLKGHGVKGQPARLHGVERPARRNRH